MQQKEHFFSYPVQTLLFDYHVALDAGRAALLGGAAVGLGGLCLYGLYSSSTASSSLSALDRAAVWPDYIRQRIHSTYAYLAGGAVVAGSSAVALVRSPGFVRVMAGGGVLAPLAMLAVSIGTGVVCQVIAVSPASIHLLFRPHGLFVFFVFFFFRRESVQTSGFGLGISCVGTSYGKLQLVQENEIVFRVPPMAFWPVGLFFSWLLTSWRRLVGCWDIAKRCPRRPLLESCCFEQCFSRVVNACLRVPSGGQQVDWCVGSSRCLLCPRSLRQLGH